MAVGCLNGLDGEGCRIFRKGRIDAAGVEPADAEGAEEMVPIDISRFELGGGGISAIWVTDGASDAVAAFGEIESVADGAADAVVFPPLDEIGRNPTLEDEVFEEVADFIIDEGGDDCGFVAEAFAEAARGIVFAAAFPDVELACGTDSSFTWVESEHDFTEGDLVELAG